MKNFILFFAVIFSLNVDAYIPARECDSSEIQSHIVCAGPETQIELAIAPTYGDPLQNYWFIQAEAKINGEIVKLKGHCEYSFLKDFSTTYSFKGMEPETHIDVSFNKKGSATIDEYTRISSTEDMKNSIPLKCKAIR